MEADPFFQQIKQDLKSGNKEHVGFQLVQDRLLYIGRVVVPHKSRLKQIILQQYHNSPAGGHGGDVKSYLRIAADWYWGGMRKDVTRYVRQCT